MRQDGTNIVRLYDDGPLCGSRRPVGVSAAALQKGTSVTGTPPLQQRYYYMILDRSIRLQYYLCNIYIHTCLDFVYLSISCVLPSRCSRLVRHSVATTHCSTSTKLFPPPHPHPTTEFDIENQIVDNTIF